MATVIQERVVRLLEQYQGRLHSSADDYEELDYIKQILASSLFQQYLREGGASLPEEENKEIMQASIDILSGMGNSDGEDDTLISPTEKKKRKVRRRQSLKALRNAVTPKGSPVVSVKKGHVGSLVLGGGAHKLGVSKSHASGTNLVGTHTAHVDDDKSGSSSRIDHNLSQVSKLHTAMNGVDKSPNDPMIYPLDDPTHPPSKINTYERIDPSLDTQMRSLSNSSGVLWVEHPSSPPGEGVTTMTKQSDGVVTTKTKKTSSQPNIDMIRITPLGNLEFDNPLITDDSDPVIISDANPLEWNSQTHPIPISTTGGINEQVSSGGQTKKKLTLSSLSPPMSRPPPPSYFAHIIQNPVLNPLVEGSETKRAPPPYVNPGMLNHRAKSYEKLLEADNPYSQYPSPLGTPRTPLGPLITPLVKPMTDGVTTRDTPTAERRKTRVLIRLKKGKEGLGFRLKGLKKELKGELYIRDLQEGGVAEKDGQLKRNDQIISINGCSLEGLPHSEAIKILQSAQGVVELEVLRDFHSNTSTSLRDSVDSQSSSHHETTTENQSANGPTHSSSVQPHLFHPPALNQPLESGLEEYDGIHRDDEVTTPRTPSHQRIVSLELPNNGHGFGFSVISDTEENRGTLVHSIVEGGIAEKDGRLKQNDLLLDINNTSVLSMNSEDVIDKLKAVSLAGQPVKLVVSRAADSPEPGMLPEISYSSDEDLEEFEVELHKPNGKGGLGITIAGLADADTGREVSGIYITSLNPLGVAGLDGQVKKGDRILKVNDVSLRGLGNMEAASVLRNSGKLVKLVLSRRKDSLVSSEESHDQHMTTHQLNGIVDSDISSPDVPTNPLKTSPMRLSPSDYHTPPVMNSDDTADMKRGQLDSDQGDSSADTEEIVCKWKKLLGPEYEVKADTIEKVQSQQSLGFRMESTADLDQNGQPQCVHHKIVHIHLDGPAHQHQIMQEGDEILEVNGHVLVGLPFAKAAEILRDTPSSVRIVVCRVTERRKVNGEVDEVVDSIESEVSHPDIVESDDNHTPSHTSTDATPRALPAIDFLLGDFTRRFERQSWRERHEEERKRLKKTFEQRREEFERHIREQEEELIQQENELKERQQRQTEEEKKRISDTDQQSKLLLLDYSTYPNSYLDSEGRDVRSPGSDIQHESGSSAGVLSPVPGSTSWELDMSEIELLKGKEGLGFSLLDFAHPHNRDDMVILVHSLVEGGTAEKDGRLKVGDRVVHVNHVYTTGQPLEFAVEQLMSVPLGSVAVIGVNHPLPVSSDCSSNPCSPLSRVSFFSEGGEFGGVVNGMENFFEEGTQSTVVDSVELHHTQDLSSADVEPEVKSPSNEEDPIVREGDEEVEEEEAHLKQKKPSDTDDEDDDEPPPPYSTYDPQEEKAEKNANGSAVGEVSSDNAMSKGHVDAVGSEGCVDAVVNEERVDAVGSEGRVDAVVNEGRVNAVGSEGHVDVGSEACVNAMVNEGHIDTVVSEGHVDTLVSEGYVDTLVSEGLDAVVSEGRAVLSEEHGYTVTEGCNEPISKGRESKESSQSSEGEEKTGNGGEGSEQPRLIPEPTLKSEVQRDRDYNSTQQNENQNSDGIRMKTLASPSETESEGSSRPATSSPLSPADLSRISSPEKGRSLSEMTRITPEDEARVSTNKSLPPVSSAVSSGSSTALLSSQSQSESTVDSSTTPVDSSTTTIDSSTTVVEQSSTTPISSNSSSSSGGGGLKLTSFLSKGRGKNKKNDKSSKSTTSESKSKSQKKSKDKGKVDPGPLDRNHTPQSPQGKGCYGQALGNSQESFIDGLSPELSDYGDHSSEVDISPREAKILRCGYSIGLNIDLDEKSNCVIVKSVSSSGAVGRDGRIRVGDCIEAINGKSLTGISLNRAKGILKRESKSDIICITYSPSPSPHFSLLSSGSYDKAHKGVANTGHQKPDPYYSMASMAASLHDQDPSSIQAQGGGAIQLQPMPPHPSHVIQQGGSVQQWQLEGMSPYHSGGAVHHVQPGYYGQMPRDDQMGKPPPPYLFHHQPTPHGPPPGRMIGGTQAPYGAMVRTSQAPPPPHQMTWSMQQPPPMGHPQGTGLMMMQHSGAPPPMSWNLSSTPQGSGPPTGMMIRDPPQYGELHAMAVAAQQQTMGSHSHTPFQLPPPTHLSQVQPSHISQTTHFTQQPTQQNTKPQQKSLSLTKIHGSSKFHSNGMELQPHILEQRQESRGLGNQKRMAPVSYKQNRPSARLRQHNSSEKIKEDQNSTARHGNEPFSSKGKARSQSEMDHVGASGGVGGLDRLHPTYPSSFTLEESPDHSPHNSWAINEEEDTLLREEFPDMEGHLFSITLNKGSSGLGLNIVSETSSKAVVRGIVIMGIKPGGMADKCGQLRWGDVILKMNNISVIGMSQEQFQKLLIKAPPTVTFVLLRPPMEPSDSTQRHAPSDSNSSDLITLDGLGLPLVKAITLIKDGKKGFGFTIERGEKSRGTSAVVVASIVQGGPAEKDGQLQVGDQILSVDGQQILGYAYEKARLLVQQARGRGQVEIIVVSRSAGSSKTTSGSDITMDTAKKLPEGVVLRGKNSLKASRRRPVSVDTDINSNYRISNGSTVGGVNIAEGGDTHNIGYNTIGMGHRDSHYTNRKSNPFTERETEQGLQHMELTNAVVLYKECEIAIYKGSKVIGLILTGGADSILKAVYVKKIVPNSPADKDGRLQPGDRILKINHMSMERASHNEALEALQQAPPYVHFTVYRDPDYQKLILNGDSTLPPPHPSPHTVGGGVSTGDVETVELLKPELGGLGLLICEHDHLPGVYVKEVVQHKAAFMDKRVRAGDKLLAINGQDTSNATQNYVVKLLKNCNRKVLLTIQHPHSSPLHPPPEFGASGDMALHEFGRMGDVALHPPSHEFGGAGDVDIETFQPRLPPEYPSYVPRLPTEREPPLYSNSTNSFENTGSGINRSFENTGSGINRSFESTGSGINRSFENTGSGIKPGSGSYSTGGYNSGSDYNIALPHQYGAPPPSSHSYSDIDMPVSSQELLEQVEVVHLHRGKEGLGFSIVGGKMNNLGELLPIYINHIFQDGAAGEDGRLKHGDKVLSVNGISFSNVTHDFAANTLKCVKGDVEITIAHSD